MNLKIHSILSVPGHQVEMLARAHQRGADQVAFDLEDSVPQDQKTSARQRIGTLLRPGDAVRVNRGRREDVLAVADSATWINLPKVESAEEVLALRELAPKVKVLAVIESPMAVLRLAEICPHVDALAFGRADFCAAAGQRGLGALILHAMGQIAMAASAFGIPAYDSPCETLSAGCMVEEVVRARLFGFTGKICLHPDQLEACKLFAPSEKELSEARETALLLGSGGRRVGNRVQAEPHYRLAGRIV